MKYYTGFWGHLSRDIMHKKRSFGKVSFAEMTRGGVEYFSPEKAGAVPPPPPGLLCTFFHMEQEKIYKMFTKFLLQNKKNPV